MMNRQFLSGNKFLSFTNHARACLPWLALFFSVCLIPYNAYIIHQAKQKIADKTQRRLQIAVSAKTISLALVTVASSILFFFTVAPIAMLLSCCKHSMDTLFGLGIAVYNRLYALSEAEKAIMNSLQADLKEQIKRGKSLSPQLMQQLNQFVNKKQQLNRDVIKNLYVLGFSVLATIGAALQLTSAAPIGALILSGTVAYSVVDYLHLNPLPRLITWIGKRLHLFSPALEPECVNNSALGNDHPLSSAKLIFSRLGKSERSNYCELVSSPALSAPTHVDLFTQKIEKSEQPSLSRKLAM